MAKASQIAQRTETATLDIVGILIKVVFYPDHFTPHVMRQYASVAALQALLSLPDVSKTPNEEAVQQILTRLDTVDEQLLSKAGDLAEIVVVMLASWDLEEDVEECEPGALVAITRERLVKFGFAFLFTFLQKMLNRIHLMGEVSSAPQNGHSSASSGAKARRKR